MTTTRATHAALDIFLCIVCNMDVGVVDIQSRKEKRQQELANLIAEAKKSVVDPVTGKCRCLSCGHVVRSVRALADHLRKHDGVNSVVYRPARIVGASSEAYDRQAVARRAAMQLGDFVNVALRTESRRQPEKGEVKRLAGGAAEVSCSNNAARNDRRGEHRQRGMEHEIMVVENPRRGRRIRPHR